MSDVMEVLEAEVVKTDAAGERTYNAEEVALSIINDGEKLLVKEFKGLIPSMIERGFSVTEVAVQAYIGDVDSRIGVEGYYKAKGQKGVQLRNSVADFFKNNKKFGKVIYSLAQAQAEEEEMYLSKCSRKGKNGDKIGMEWKSLPKSYAERKKDAERRNQEAVDRKVQESIDAILRSKTDDMIQHLVNNKGMTVEEATALVG